MTDIITIKLVTGEEVVGRQVSITADEIVLNKPVRIHVDVDQATGRPAIYPAPDFLFSVDESTSVVIWRNAIIAGPMPTRQEIAGPYLQATSNIIMPTEETKGKIILT